MDPSEVHEYLIYAIFIFMLPALIVNFLYIRSLSDFFLELAKKDPEAWQAVGSPKPGEQYSNSRRNRPPILKILGLVRKKSSQGGYPAAEGTMRWFIRAAIFTGLLLITAITTIAWIEINNL